MRRLRIWRARRRLAAWMKALDEHNERVPRRGASHAFNHYYRLWAEHREYLRGRVADASDRLAELTKG